MDASPAISPWPGGADVAVVLTYDDALDSHLDIAIPQLNQRNLPATFYVSGARPAIRMRLDEWRQAARRGHELGNHMLYHPCRKSISNRDWVKPWQDLDGYTLEQFLDEVQVTNSMLEAIDGQQQRTFAYPCGDMIAGGEDVIPGLKKLVSAARLFSIDGQHQPGNSDFYRIASFDGAEKSAAQLIAVVEAARENHSLVGFMFHGVGGDYITVSADAHRALLEHLAAHPDRYWVATMREAVAHLQREQSRGER
ncbi:polysaccharide deacetylase family protein [Microbulbifer bruguierae]|uniref:Polysaccharide deacetylase family protein n=1 Tax=Microbulbifer bruguierae TaxID=3029061 RepID=A0ABY8NFW2_9GAMM|nr:polysaccharide deacetylase family protein [Microbulbifer bruguierae]WGL17811.1 polysaccharide deacetylase family protein [Microbulbifer bruguierae]